MREVVRDPAAEAAASAAEEKRAALRRRKDALRKKRERREKKHGRKASAPDAGVRAQVDDPQDAASEPDRSGGLGGVLAAGDTSAAPPTAEEAAAQAALEQFGSAEKVAEFLARLQKVAEIAASKSARGAKVVAALDWANADGSPTDSCKMGVELAWPWLSAGGMEWLAFLGPGFMATCGAAVLFGPAVIVAWDELEAHRADRAKLVTDKKDDEKKDDNVTKLRTPEAKA